MKSRIVQHSVKNVYSKFIYYSIATLLICLLQLSFSFLISIKNVTPDLLILLVVWITLYDGKIAGLTSGFVIGFLYDYLSLNVLGVNALTKTIAAYITSFFYKENEFWNILKSYKIFIISITVIFIHNIFYYLFMINLTEANIWSMYFKYVFGSTIYTFFFTLFSFFLRIRKFW